MTPAQVYNVLADMLPDAFLGVDPRLQATFQWDQWDDGAAAGMNLSVRFEPRPAERAGSPQGTARRVTVRVKRGKTAERAVSSAADATAKLDTGASPGWSYISGEGAPARGVPRTGWR